MISIEIAIVNGEAKFSVGQRVRIKENKVHRCIIKRVKFDSVKNLVFYFVHYLGWGTHFDKWVEEKNILVNK